MKTYVVDVKLVGFEEFTVQSESEGDAEERGIELFWGPITQLQPHPCAGRQQRHLLKRQQHDL